jgi:hypothetical protein
MATVRIFSYSELLSAPINPSVGRPIGDSLFLLREPYLQNETLSPTTGSAATSAAVTAPAKTKLLKVQVASGQQVHYEVTPNNQDLRTATTDSPITSGEQMFSFNEGDRISFLEVS